MIILETTLRKIPKSSGEEVVVVKRNVGCESLNVVMRILRLQRSPDTTDHSGKSWARLLSPSSTSPNAHFETLPPWLPGEPYSRSFCLYIQTYWLRTPFWRADTTSLPKLLPGPFAHLWKRRSGSLLRSADWPPRDTKSGRMDSVDHTCVFCVTLCELLTHCHTQTTIQEDAQKK